MDSLHTTSAGATPVARQHGAGNLVWDAGFEAWKCELHFYTDQEIRLDRCARGGDRLRVETVRATEERFSVAYTICPGDSDRPKCLSLVSCDFRSWDQAVDCAGDIASAFIRRTHDDPRHAVLGHWNAWHIIDDEVELRAWRWDGKSVFDLKRQTILLDTCPETLHQYASSIPPHLRVEEDLRLPDEAMQDRYLMNIVAVDRQGFALIQTTWNGTSGCDYPPGYTVLPMHAAQDLLAQYRRCWLRAHAMHDQESAGRLP